MELGVDLLVERPGGRCADECPGKPVQYQLLWQASWHRSMHRGAAEREVDLREQVRELKTQLKQSQEEVASLQGQVRQLNKRLYGIKSEKGKPAPQSPADKGRDANAQGGTQDGEKKRSRGQQPGSKGHGRRKHPDLPARTQSVDLPEDQKICACCGLAYAGHGVVESETIEIDVQAYRRVYRRQRYVATCSCPGTPATVVAPPPPKLIPRGILGTSAWVEILLDKFHYQQPTNRLLADLRTLGLDLAPGTITGGFAWLMPLFEPVYQRMVGRCLESNRWFADETRWSVFEKIEGKEGHRWYFWLLGSPEVLIYLLDPSRAASVVKDFFGDGVEGILNVDRYVVYKSLSREQKLLVLAFCWVHVRRDFIEVTTGWPELAGWAQKWVNTINELFALNELRLVVLDDATAFATANDKLVEHLAMMKSWMQAELSTENDERLLKPLRSLENHWAGLNVFVDHPEVPPDNNRSEREVRHIAVARKNYYGSGAAWMGQFTAMLFSIFGTIEVAKINIRHWLSDYLEACAAAGGKAPEDIESWLPWTMDEQRRRSLSSPRPVESDRDTS
jgi:transposase